MCSKVVFFLFNFMVFVNSVFGRKESRKGRLFTFNTVEGDLMVGLDFQIPFINIPMQRTMDLGLPTVNINPAALALGGAIVLGATVMLPLVLKKFASHYPERRYSRIIENTEFGADVFLDFASHMMSDGRGLHGCMLRIACWSSQTPTISDYKAAWEIITSNKLLSSLINATTIEDAVISGSEGRDCMSYTPCPLSKHHLLMLMDHFAVFTKSYG